MALGEAVREHIERGNKRSDLFIVTKIHPVNLGEKKSRKALENMFKELQMDYIDLVLIHFPICNDMIQSCKNVSDYGTWEQTWKVMEEYYYANRVRAIGLSNFDAEKLTRALEIAQIKPHVVQNWMDPFHLDSEVRNLCAEHGIAYTAYSTLGNSWRYRRQNPENPVKNDPIIQKIAADKSISWVNLVLYWALQSNVIVLPRSTDEEHIFDNAKLLTMEENDSNLLTLSEIEAIEALQLM